MLFRSTAKRARQLIAGEEAMVYSHSKKPLSVAVEELYESKVKILSEDDFEENEVEETSLEENDLDKTVTDTL